MGLISNLEKLINTVKQLNDNNKIAVPPSVHNPNNSNSHLDLLNQLANHQQSALIKRD